MLRRLHRRAITPERIGMESGPSRPARPNDFGLANKGYNTAFAGQTEIAQQLLGLKLNLSSVQRVLPWLM